MCVHPDPPRRGELWLRHHGLSASGMPFVHKASQTPPASLGVTRKNCLVSRKQESKSYGRAWNRGLTNYNRRGMKAWDYNINHLKGAVTKVNPFRSSWERKKGAATLLSHRL